MRNRVVNLQTVRDHNYCSIGARRARPNALILAKKGILSNLIIRPCLAISPHRLERVDYLLLPFRHFFTDANTDF